MADTIIDGTEFNAEAVVHYSAPKAGATGAKTVNIMNAGTKSGIRVATPLMLTWGASDFVDGQTGKGNGKFDMSLQFPSADYQNADSTAFLQNMIKFEEKIKADALINSKEWFGKVHKSAEIVEALYSPMLKYSKDKATGEPDQTKAPVLKVKLPLWEGTWRCSIYDEDGAKIFPNGADPAITPLDLIVKGSMLAVVMQCGGLWFANGKFGVTWKLVQAVVQKPKASLLDQCYIRLKPAEKATMKSIPAVDLMDREEEPVRTTYVEDSDDDEASAPPPKPLARLASEVVFECASTFSSNSASEAAEAKTDEVLVDEEPKKKKIIKKKTVTAADA